MTQNRSAEDCTDITDKLVMLRDSFEIERDMAMDDGRGKDARYHHGKVVAVQTAIEIVEREVSDED